MNGVTHWLDKTILWLAFFGGVLCGFAGLYDRAAAIFAFGVFWRLNLIYSPKDR